MSNLELRLVIAMCPKSYGSLTAREREFWHSRAKIAMNLMVADSLPRPIFRWLRGRKYLGWLRGLLMIGTAKQGWQSPPVARKGKVRLHPLPEGAPPLLAPVIGAAVAGAIRDCLNAHPMRLSRHQRGLLVGSSRKRAVNQLVCPEGVARLKMALGPDNE